MWGPGVLVAVAHGFESIPMAGIINESVSLKYCWRSGAMEPYDFRAEAVKISGVQWSSNGAIEYRESARWMFFDPNSTVVVKAEASATSESVSLEPWAWMLDSNGYADTRSQRELKRGQQSQCISATLNCPPATA